jgi:ATP-binding cassette subfamily B protein RaxB
MPASIELKNVSFRYGESEDWILKDVSLKIEPGECIAITGPSGSGKTTLLKIVLGLLEPTEGEVLYGGKKIRSIGFDGYRSLAGSVMQEDCLVQGTIYDNIALFDDVQDEARIKEAARKARVLTEIEKMPMGFNSLVGDLGSGLSGGKKQRVMLARALYRSPKFLVLDEATSHLDKENEESIARELASMEITRLVVAHRKETVDAANRVVILFGGKLISDISKNSENAQEQLAVSKLSIADRVKAMLQESGLAQHPQLTAT